MTEGTMLWSCVSMLLSVVTVLLYLLVFVDRWRIPLRKGRAMMVGLAAADAGMIIAAFLIFSDVRTAGLVGMTSNMIAVALMLLLVPWRGGLLLFVLSTAFLGGCFPYYIFRIPGPVNLLIQLLVNLTAFALMYRYFRPLFRSAILTGNAAWPLIALVPLSFTLIHLVLVGLVLLGPEQTGASSFEGLSLPGVPILAIRLLMIVLPVSTYLLLYQLFGVLDRQYRAYRDNLLRNAQLTAMERQEREDRKSVV